MRICTYKRVSTKEQGKSGLGLEAQQRDIDLYLKHYAAEYELLAEFTDVESGKTTDRDGYQQVLKLCKEKGAVLLVAKLDRISRDVETVAGLIKQVDLKVACMPQADKFQLHLYAALAEQERDFISLRTKQALQAKKAQGYKLGNEVNFHNNREKAIKHATKTRSNKANAKAEQLKGIVLPLRTAGKTLQYIANQLNAMQIKTTRGGEWSHVTVMLLIRRIEAQPQ